LHRAKDSICVTLERRFIVVSDEIPLLYSASCTLSRCVDLLEGVKPTILVADPVYLMVKGDNAGNLFSMGEQIRPAAELCQELGITFVLVHHATKSSEAVKGLSASRAGRYRLVRFFGVR
jgi:RecA-family ATPase